MPAELRHLVIVLGDQPAVRPEAIRAIVEAAHASPAPFACRTCHRRNWQHLRRQKADWY